MSAIDLNNLTLFDIENELAVLAERHGWDWKLHVDVAHECGWASEITVVTNPSRDSADLAVTAYAIGPTAEGAASRAMAGIFSRIWPDRVWP